MNARILIVEDEEAADAAAALQPRGGRLRGRDGRARRRGRHAAARKARPTSSCSTGCCRACPASSCAAGCARGRRPSSCRSSCSPRAARRASACAGSRPAPTTTSSSRSRCPSCSRGCGALLRRASPERVADVLSFGDIELDREKKRVSRAGRADRSRSDRIPAARIPDGAARPRVLARAIARRRVGHARSISTSAPSTCMSAGCARRSTAAMRTIRSAPCAAPAMRSTIRFGRRSGRLANA